MSKKILSLLGPVFVIAAFMALPAMASATTVRFAEGGEVKAGAAVRGSSSNLVTRTREEDKGNLECATSDIAGTATSNTTASLTAGTFAGGGEGGRCKTTVSALFGVASAEIRLENLPWCLTLGNDTWNLKACSHGTNGAKIAFISHLFDPVLGKVASCRFEIREVNGTYNRGATPTVLTVGAGTTFTSTTGGLCPKKGDLTGGFTFTANGKGVKID